jgi:hypothetical protein
MGRDESHPLGDVRKRVLRNDRVKGRNGEGEKRRIGDMMNRVLVSLWIDFKKVQVDNKRDTG